MITPISAVRNPFRPVERPTIQAASEPKAQPSPSNTGWMPGLAGQYANFMRFAGERKIAPTANAEDNYVRYTAFNTPCPLATWHTLVESEALNYHKKNAEVLEKYIEGTGEYYQDIPWVKYGKKVGEEPYTIFDTETTGTDWDDRIVQLAASQADGNHEIRHLTDFNTYVNPGVDESGNMFPIHPGAEATHGISAEVVKDKPTIEKFLYEFRKNTLKENGLSVAYNAKFDIGKLNYAIDRWNKSPNRRQVGYIRPLEPALIVDPFVIMQRIHPFVSLRKRLGDHYTILMGKPLENKHDAQADVDGTVDVLKYTLKYLEKHSIPLEWAKWAESHLPTKDLTPENKASLIARFVRENRDVLKAKVPYTSEPLKITDVLKFQHGAPVYWEKSGLPKVDILLNFSGWDGSKKWVDQDDYLDADLAGAVRQERDTENRKFLQARFTNELTSQSVEEAALTLNTLINPTKSEDKLSRTALKNYKDGLLQNLVKNLFVEPLLAHTLPAPEENWRASKEWKQIRNNVKRELNTAVETLLKNKSIKAQARQKLDDRLKPLADDIVAHMNVVLRDVGGRFFYTLEPVNPAKLIDPAVLEQPGNGKAQPVVRDATPDAQPAAEPKKAAKAPTKRKPKKLTKKAPVSRVKTRKPTPKAKTPPKKSTKPKG